MVANVCPAMQAFPQFILRAGKMPINPHTFAPFAKDGGWQQDPTQWTTYADAAAKAAACGFELGFLFTPQDPFWFIDVDHALIAGAWSPLAQAICARFYGAAVEVSQSGEGLHLFGQGYVPDHSCKNLEHGLELYTSGRYVALTGTNLTGSASAVHDLSEFVAEYFPPGQRAEGANWTDEPAPRYIGPTDDNELIDRALAARTAAGAFGKGATFKQLWQADADALAVAFPHKEKAWDFSSADAALAMHLAFWTGKDCERMRRLMMLSGLVRDKWERETYIVPTVLSAARKCTAYPGVDIDPAPKVQAQVAEVGEVPTVTALAGMQYLGPDLQAEHFAGCVYVAREDRISTPTGELLKRSAFDTLFGGFTFQLDDSGRLKTKSAWEAFTVSQVLRHPKVMACGLRPDLPPRTIYERDGVRCLNTYLGGTGPQVAGDVAPFIQHTQKLLPDAGDQAILYAYLAAMVQHPGVKFAWAPFIQGVEGNGKSLYIRLMQYCIGPRYTFLPKAKEITEKFNGWMFTNQFIGVNDLWIPDEARGTWEELKPMITEDRLPRRGMQSEWVTDYTCANFILNSNHKAAVPRDANDRRAAPLYTAQQSTEDLLRDGMAGDYFPALYAWLRQGGYAAVAHWLATYPIPYELNPASGAHRAPKTSSDAESVAQSLGVVEQEILEAIEEGKPGFIGGWVSSVALATLLEQARLAHRAPKSRRREIMAAIGYVTHPALRDGRLSQASGIDGNVRPRVYLRRGHLALSLTDPAAIAQAYFNAQQRIAA